MGRIVVFFGLIASGKSTLAEKFGADLHALYLNTDRVRKQLAGIEVTQHMPDDVGQGIYTPEFTERTYATMLKRAAERLSRGEQVVLDGSYSRRADRAAVIACGRERHADVRFILCFCSDTEVKRRLALRALDAEAVSDGRWDIYLHQKETFEPPDELTADQLLRLNTEDTPVRLSARIHQWLKL